MKLIIAEKPSVAKELAAQLGKFTRHTGSFASDKYVISWCIGHMAELVPPEDYTAENWAKWALETLPMLPKTFQLRPLKRTMDHWRHLKKLLQDNKFESIINACDAGREGELIFRYVYELAGSRRPVERLWLSSLTPTAINKAFNNLKDGAEYDNLFHAARCRSEADWLVGLNATRAMTLATQASGHQGGVKSVGRVQTPTLALIVERDRAIREHVPQPFYNIFATFSQGKASWEGMLLTKEDKNRINKKEDADAILEKLKVKSEGAVTAIDTKEKPIAIPLPYDLPTLQREANTRLGITAQQTLDAAQGLYERKLLTYPRTDSRYLTKDMKPGMMDIIKAINPDPWESPDLKDGADLAEEIKARAHAIEKAPQQFPINHEIFNDEKVTDHHAILPTELSLTPTVSAQLSKNERGVYELVQRRFIAQFLGKAVFSVSRIEVTIDDYKFETVGTQVIKLGWQAIEPPRAKSKEIVLPNVVKGAAVLNKRWIKEGVTKPPPHYTEASLLGAMENAGRELDEKELRAAMKEAGLGTAATRASIIETIIRREYVARANKNLIATENGMSLIDSITEPGLKSPQLTARWEAALLRIEQGKLARADFMQKVEKFTTAIVYSIQRADLKFEKSKVVGACPLCKKPVRDTGKVFSCDSGRACSLVVFKSVAGKPLTESNVKALLAGQTIGPLSGFISKKKTKFEASLKLDEEGKTKFVFENNKPSAERQTK